MLTRLAVSLPAPSMSDIRTRVQDDGRRGARRSIMESNALLADPRGVWRATMLPTGEGLAMAVRMR